MDIRAFFFFLGGGEKKYHKITRMSSRISLKNYITVFNYPTTYKFLLINLREVKVREI